MDEKILPKIQIFLAILFGVIVLFTPFLIPSLEGILFLGAAVGLGLGIVTFLIGWWIIKRKKKIIYPFQEWSVILLKPFFGAQAVSELGKKPKSARSSGQKWIGIASLIGGGCIAAITFGIILFALAQSG